MKLPFLSTSVFFLKVDRCNTINNEEDRCKLEEVNELNKIICYSTCNT